MRAAQMFLKRVSEKPVDHFDVTLYGSPAATGKGHLTDGAIYDTLSIAAPVNIKWEPKVFLPFHPNGMHFEAMTATARKLDEWTVYSIGGGNTRKKEFKRTEGGRMSTT